MVIRNHGERRARIGKVCFALWFVAIALTALSAQSQELGHTQGKIIAFGEEFDFKYAYFYTENHPINEGQKGYGIKITADEARACDRGGKLGSSGNRVVVGFDSEGQVYFSRAWLQTSNGIVFEDDLGFEFKLQETGPENYRGSITGAVEIENGLLEFALRFAAAPRGKPLAAGGGEAGKAYLAVVEAISSGDWNKISGTFTEDMLEQTKASGMSDAEMAKMFVQMNPTEVEIVGGISDGRTACLKVKVVMMGEPNAGSISMEKIDGNWMRIEERW